MQNLPAYISLVFILTTLLSIVLFYAATERSTKVLLVLLAWTGLQGITGWSGFYTITSSIPPRTMLLLLPPLLLIIILFLTSAGKLFLDKLDLKSLTLLHVVRIPVEIILLWLYLHKAVPEIMTFEGGNLDILSGMSTPVVYYFAFIEKKLNRQIILLWNIVCLMLLLNIVSRAVLSLPGPLQQLGLHQPNIAVLHFPFLWLPCCIVPLVLLAHLAALRQLLNKKKKFL